MLPNNSGFETAYCTSLPALACGPSCPLDRYPVAQASPSYQELFEDIDENTAAFFAPDGTMEVVGQGTVTVIYPVADSKDF